MLTHVDGQPLPANIIDITAQDGTTYQFKAVRGTLRFFAGGTFRSDLVVLNVWNGVPADTLGNIAVSGVFETQGDTAVVVRFGGTNRRTYQVLERGDVLRGVQGIQGAFLATYAYRRN